MNGKIFGATFLTVAMAVASAVTARSQNFVALATKGNGPVAVFSISPNPCERGQSVRFNASGSYHNDTSHAIVRYEWDFDGDGTFEVSGRLPAHVFAEYGSYAIALRVTDDNVPPKTAIVTNGVDVSLGNHPPLADAKGPYVVEVGKGVLLDASTSFDSDDGDAIMKYEWDLDGDGTYEYSSDEATIVVPWSLLSVLPQTGVANAVTLRVTDAFDAKSTDATTLTLFDNQPVATFDVRPDGVLAIGEPVRFDASASHNDFPSHHIVQYLWDFDNNGVSDATGVQVTNRFSAFGSYTVSLSVIDDNLPAKTSTVSKVIQVTAGNRPPYAVAGGPYVTILGESLNLDASGSSDPNPGDSIVCYRWDLDGDGTYDLTFTQPKATVSWNTWHALPHFGETNIIRLCVADSFGAESTDTAVFTLCTNAPVADFTVRPDNPVGTNQPVRFDASTSRHGFPARHIVSYEWDFDGNGTYEETGVQVTNRYASAGVYTVTLRVTDDNTPPLTAVTNRTVIVTGSSGNHAPWADAKGPYLVETGGGVLLDAGASSDPDANDAIYRYEWDMDGNGSYDLTSSQPTLAVTWSQLSALPYPGVTNNLILRVTDYNGGVSFDRTTLTIFNNQPVAAFEVHPNCPLALGEPVRFDASASHHEFPSRHISQYLWDFDNNGVSDAAGVQVTNVFTAFGNYTVSLSVIDDNTPAKTSTVTRVVQVTRGNRPPQADAGGPYRVASGSGLKLDAASSSDPDAGDSIVSYRWDLNGDGTNDLTSSKPTVAVTWAQLSSLPNLGATQTVHLLVEDSFGATSSDSAALMIYDDDLVAMISTSAGQSVEPGDPVRFDASLSYLTYPAHAIVSYAWDFDGDGVYETNGVRVIKSFGRFGEYPVRLRVTDDSIPARTAEASLTVMVNQGNRQPMANAGGPYTVEFGNGLPLDGTGATDPDVSFGDSLVEYRWDIANGTLSLSGEKPTLTSEEVLLLNRGSVPVTLTVMDSFGATDVAESEITIPALRFAGMAQTSTRTGKGISLQMAGLSGRFPLTIEASTNLLDWDLLSTEYPGAGVFEYVDGTFTNSPVRFYRAIESSR